VDNDDQRKGFNSQWIRIFPEERIQLSVDSDDQRKGLNSRWIMMTSGAGSTLGG